jgi:hypothetical protein
MKKHIVLLVSVLAMAGCKTVTTTTTEIRPARYAVLEFTRPVSRDSIAAYAERAVRDEKLPVLSIDRTTGEVNAGPVKYAATAELPALNATVAITSTTQGGTSTVRIHASSTLEQNQVGGVDSRLMELVQRIERRLDVMIGK